MNSPDPSPAISDNVPAGPFSHKVRLRISAIPERMSEAETSADRSLDGFSIARIYTTFQLKRGEYFPDGLSNAAFEILIDLFLFEWLNRRVGSAKAAGIRLASRDDMPPGAADLIAQGFASVTPADRDRPDAVPTLHLSRAGRARLNVFFDYMANYISAI
jgi:hypothetical protein